MSTAPARRTSVSGRHCLSPSHFSKDSAPSRGLVHARGHVHARVHAPCTYLPMLTPMHVRTLRASTHRAHVRTCACLRPCACSRTCVGAHRGARPRAHVRMPHACAHAYAHAYAHVACLGAPCAHAHMRLPMHMRGPAHLRRCTATRTHAHAPCISPCLCPRTCTRRASRGRTVRACAHAHMRLPTHMRVFPMLLPTHVRTSLRASAHHAKTYADPT